MYALKAPDTKRQYPRRFQYFLNFLGIPGKLEQQAEAFDSNARQNLIWAQESLMSFIDYEKERVRKGEIAESTIANYYKATKLFCVMNDIALNCPREKDFSGRQPTLIMAPNRSCNLSQEA